MTCCTTKVYEDKCDTCRADAMERTVMQMLGQTRYGDCRPAYRNMATGKLSFPVLSEREMEART